MGETPWPGQVRDGKGPWEWGSRGFPVLAVTKAIPDTPWRLVAKVDVEEIYRALYREARLIITGVIALILMVGTVLGWMLSAQRKRHYEALYGLECERQAIRTHFEYLVKYASDIILLMDQEGNLKEVNDRAVAAYGYDREELLQLNIRDLVSENEMVAPSQWRREEQAKSGRIYEGHHRRRDGGAFPVEISPNFIRAEGKQYFQEIVRDITARKQAEEELNLRGQLLDGASDSIFLHDLDGHFLYLNEAAYMDRGYEREELLAKNLSVLVTPEFAGVRKCSSRTCWLKAKSSSSRPTSGKMGQ